MNMTLHKVTDETFDPEAYLNANPDVADAGMSAEEHYRTFGRNEERFQLAPIDARFKRFREVLEAPWDAFRSFPIFTTGAYHELSQYLAESANPGFPPYDDEVRANPDKLYMDLGCGRRKEKFDNCLYLEVYPSVSADVVVEPNCLYPIRSGSLDGIGCFAVLEHCRKPWQVVAEITRMLKPGGKAFIDWPFLQPVHGFPSHFFNTTREGLRSVFEDNGFEVEICTTGAHQTPAYSVEWLLRAFCNNLEGSLRDEFEALTVKELVTMDRQGNRWWRFLNALSPEGLSELACGNYLIGSKRA